MTKLTNNFFFAVPESEMKASQQLEQILEVLIGIGLVIAAYALSEIIKGVRGTHDRKLDWSCIPPDARTGVQRICRFGVATRGGLLATLGVFLMRAGATTDPSQAAGSRESFLRLAGVIEGRWFLALVAAGVVAYAVDQAVHAACRRIRPVV